MVMRRVHQVRLYNRVSLQLMRDNNDGESESHQTKTWRGENTIMHSQSVKIIVNIVFLNNKINNFPLEYIQVF